MKNSKIFLILIIGIISLNVLFAGQITQKSYLIKGELTITPNLETACILGSTGVCSLDIYSPYSSTSAVKHIANKSAEGIKQDLISGVMVGPISISSSDTLTFTIKIKNQIGIVLLETPITSINPSSGINIVSDYLKNTAFANADVCGASNIGNVAVIDNQLSRCVYNQDGGSSSYSWTLIPGAETPYISNFLQLFQKFDANKFTAFSIYGQLKITLKPITTDMIANNAITLEKLDVYLQNRIGTHVNSNVVDTAGTYNDYIKVQSDNGNWYYIKLYPAASFVTFNDVQACFNYQPPAGSNAVNVPIERYRIVGPITVSPMGVVGSPYQYAVQYTSGNDYFTITAAQKGNFSVTISGTDDQGISRSHTGHISFGDWSFCEETPPTEGDMRNN